LRLQIKSSQVPPSHHLLLRATAYRRFAFAFSDELLPVAAHTCLREREECTKARPTWQGDRTLLQYVPNRLM